MTLRRGFWMRWRVRAGYLVAVAYWLLARPTPRSVWMGAIVAGLGLAIRAAAAGHLRKDRELAISGPYARTRNPLYLGSFFLAAGFVVAGSSWWSGVLVAAYFALFYYGVMRNEEQHLRERFGESFDAYAARVPLFFPRMGSRGAAARPPGSGFSWAQYRRNREYQALIGTILALGAVALRMWLRVRAGF
ncbi:MAG TPA: isoprenylcysteine carboxylmethyltransferase family protein [Candidatus Acidoferrales bacterium]|nr:isoprenylcysteine carboxylmethyltransferase family protein [Candidatus Acidoferrales bacterium]